MIIHSSSNSSAFWWSFFKREFVCVLNWYFFFGGGQIKMQCQNDKMSITKLCLLSDFCFFFKCDVQIRKTCGRIPCKCNILNFIVAHGPPACDEHWFKCSEDGSECVPQIWRCDGDNDCTNKADETNCPKPNCTELEFQCKPVDSDSNNYKCFARTKLCNKKQDCADNSDEEDCRK